MPEEASVEGRPGRVDLREVIAEAIDPIDDIMVFPDGAFLCSYGGSAASAAVCSEGPDDIVRILVFYSLIKGE